MKRKALSIIMALALMFCAIPMTAISTQAAAQKIKSVELSKNSFQSGKSKISIKVSFKEKIKSATVYVQTKNKTVKSLKISNSKSKSMSWNGKSDDGNYVPAGKYRLKIKCSGSVKYSKWFTVKPSSAFSGGYGTEKQPYLVSSAKQLKQIVKFNGCYFKQKQNINLGYKALNLFSEQNQFTGKYDGNGYTIKNYLYSSTSKVDGISLFGVIGKKGIVKNLRMENVTISCGNSAAGIAVKNYGKIYKCVVKGTISTVGANRDYSHYAGMICSENYGKILKCKSHGTITAKYSDDLGVKYIKSHAAGIVAYNEGSVSDCYSSTAIEVTSGDTDCYAGGIVAKNKGIVADSDAKGAVNAHARTSLFGFGTGYAGGIVGFNEATISGCLFLGKTENLVGESSGDIYGGKI